ncbi:MAG: anticodon-binding domain-containing protein [Piptocephalis tieghemiana]|nr:MAG: anticodon-binding domain-containing protein [Piptocephalis tieghemiana]
MDSTPRFQRKPSAGGGYHQNHGGNHHHHGSSSGSRGNHSHPSSSSSSSSSSSQLGFFPTSDSSWILGASVKLKTLAGSVVEGEVYSYDTVAGIIALQRPPQNGPAPDGSPRWDYTIVRLAQIKEIIHIRPHPSSSSLSNSNSSTTTHTPLPSSLPKVGYTHLERIRIRESTNVRNARTDQARLGVGVTEDAQKIFDALSKTLPCRWAKQSIVVLDEVIIHSPYTEDSCKANAEHASTLSRVQRVLQGERGRLGLSETSS